MSPANRAYMLAAQLLAHNLEHVSMPDIKASLSCRSAMLSAAADMAVSIALSDGCQEKHEGAMAVAMAVARASGLDDAAICAVWLDINTRIDLAYGSTEEQDFDVRELVSSPVFRPA